MSPDLLVSGTNQSSLIAQGLMVKEINQSIQTSPGLMEGVQTNLSQCLQAYSDKWYNPIYPKVSNLPHYLQA